MDSILLTVKSSLGVEIDYEGFDTEIILAINTAFMTLNQLGVGPTEGYKITNFEDAWTDFLAADVINLEAVKTFVQLKSRLIFDPPPNSFLVEAINREITQLEWRLTVQAEPPIT